MKTKLEEIDKKILRLAQGDLPVCREPFAQWADEIGISVVELLSRLTFLKDLKIIRDFKAILRHRKAGIEANAMVAWRVDESKVDETGKLLAGFEEITHCYERPDFHPYNVFTMLHARTRDEIMIRIRDISIAAGIDDYKIFWSKNEFKKSSMQYFK